MSDIKISLLDDMQNEYKLDIYNPRKIQIKEKLKYGLKSYEKDTIITTSMQNIFVWSRYSYLYPIVLKIGDEYKYFPKETLFLYNPINNAFFRYYPIYYECFSKEELQNIKFLSISSYLADTESILYYNMKNNGEKNSFTSLVLSYFNIPEKIKDQTEHYHELKKLYNKVKFNYLIGDDSKIYIPSVFNETSDKINNKYNLISIDVIMFNVWISFAKHQIEFASIVMGLSKLEKDGSLIFRITKDYFYGKYIKQIIYFLCSYFNTSFIYSPKIRPHLAFIICKGFKGISDSDIDKLNSILSKWYKIDKSGGVDLCDNTFMLKNNKVCVESDNKIVYNIFDFGYDDKYNKIFQKFEDHVIRFHKFSNKLNKKYEEYNINQILIKVVYLGW